MNRRDLLKAGASLALGPILLPRSGFAQASASPLPLPAAGADGWVSLLNGHDLTGWYSMLEKSGKDAAQTKRMVTMEEGMLHIMGNEATGENEEDGYLATNQEFENVHIRVEYKWGMKRFAPHALTKRDNGLLYGLVGKDKVWPTCVECQIEEGDVGDFFLVGGIRGISGRHDDGLSAEWISAEHGWPKPGSVGAEDLARRPKNKLDPALPAGRIIKDGDFENLNDWNVVEVIWQGDRAVHIVNGRTVAAVTNLEQPDPQNHGQFIPLTRGKIAIEIEYAEIWYRRIEVKSLV